MELCFFKLPPAADLTAPPPVAILPVRARKGFLKEVMPTKPMTVTLKDKTQLVVPPRIQRLAGIKSGDRVEFKVSARTITIQPVEVRYKPTKAEWAAIRKGEAEIARGEYVTLTDLLHELDHPRRKGGTKTTPKASR